MKNQDLDKIFRDALREQEVIPPKNLWDKIERELEQEIPALPIEKKRMVRVHWLPYTVAASLLLILGIGYLTWQHSPVAEHTFATTEEKPTISQQSQNSLPIQEPEQIREKDEKQFTPTFHEEKTTSPPTSKGIERTELRQAAKLTKEISPEQQQLGIGVSGASNTHDERKYVSIASENGIILETAHMKPEKTIYIEVTEVEPVKPLVESFDDEDDGKMFASEDRKTKGSILHGVKTLVSENISALTGRDVSISTDDEGSLRIDLGNTLVRNRNKKRK